MSILDQVSSYAGALEPGVRLPEIKIPDRFYKKLGIAEDSTNYSFLSQYCRQQLAARHLDNKLYQDRLNVELDVINDLGFVDYMLLNWDIINYCVEESIPTGSGRGSAASSLILFLLDVTKIDPLRYGLVFERFINKARAKKIKVNGIDYLDGSLLPDVDSDISYDKRQKVIEYIENKYKGKTAKILTLSSLSSKICLKEVAKACLNVSEIESRELSDMIPKHHGKVDSIAKAWKDSVKLQAWGLENKRVLEIARKLEGLYKNVGVHASGIAISYYELTDVCPVGKTKDGALVVYYDKDDTANLMVKFDILGLRTLTVASDTCKLLNIDIETIDPETPEIYDHLQDLQTPKGLFQIEAETNYRVCRKVKPKNLSALSDVIAIGRPGALAYLNEYVSNNQDVQDDLREINPKLHEILTVTNGVPLYQEQLLKIASDVFKFTLSEAETLRRIVGRKLVEEVKAWEAKIYAKAVEIGLDKSVADFYWKLLNDSANYSFNKCAFEEELVEEKSKGQIMLKDVQIGDLVKAYNVETDCDHLVEVLDVMANERELYEITLEDGRSLKISLDHKLLCEDKVMRPLREIIKNGYSVLTD